MLNFNNWLRCSIQNRLTWPTSNATSQGALNRRLLTTTFWDSSIIIPLLIFGIKWNTRFFWPSNLVNVSSSFLIPILSWNAKITNKLLVKFKTALLKSGKKSTILWQRKRMNAASPKFKNCLLLMLRLLLLKRRVRNTKKY